MPTSRLHLHHLAAEQLLRGGHIAQGLDILQGVLKQAGLRMVGSAARVAFGALAFAAAARAWHRFRRTAGIKHPVAERRLLDVLWSANIGLGMVDILRADDFLLHFLFLALR